MNLIFSCHVIKLIRSLSYDQQNVNALEQERKTGEKNPELTIAELENGSVKLHMLSLLKSKLQMISAKYKTLYV